MINRHPIAFDVIYCVPARGRKCRQIIGKIFKVMTIKNKILSLMLLVSASATLTSCYTDFEPDLESTPVVCLNSRIIAGSKIKAEVTRTWRYSEGNPASEHLNIYLNDSEVALYVNDRFEEDLELGNDTVNWHEIKPVFKAKYIPQEGDKIKLVVTNKTYGNAEAEVTVPHAVDIEKVETKVSNEEISENSDTKYSSTFDMLVNVSFTDPANSVNYYLFDIERGSFEDAMEFDFYPEYDNVRESVVISPDYSREPLFSEHITPIETVISDGYGLYTVFSDRQISGKHYTLDIPTECGYNWSNEDRIDVERRCTIDVNLYHISPEYYKYMLSLWAATEGISGALGDVGLGQPVWEFSNVSTGAGIVAAAAVSTVTLKAYNLLTKDKE